MKLVFLAVLLSYAFVLPKDEHCDALKFKIEIIHTTNGEDNGKIKIKNLQSSSKVKAFLYGDNKTKNRLDTRLNKLDRLAAGRYTLILQNGECTSLKRDIIIE